MVKYVHFLDTNRKKKHVTKMTVYSIYTIVYIIGCTQLVCRMQMGHGTGLNVLAPWREIDRPTMAEYVSTIERHCIPIQLLDSLKSACNFYTSPVCPISMAASNVSEKFNLLSLEFEEHCRRILCGQLHKEGCFQVVICH